MSKLHEIGTVIKIEGIGGKYIIINRALGIGGVHKYWCFPVSCLEMLGPHRIAELKNAIVEVFQHNIKEICHYGLSSIIFDIFQNLFPSESAPGSQPTPNSPPTSSSPISQPNPGSLPIPVGQSDPVIDRQFRNVDQRMATHEEQMEAQIDTLTKREEQMEAQLDDLTKRLDDLEKAHLVKVCQTVRPYHVHSLGHDCLQVRMSERGKYGMNQSGCPCVSTMVHSGPSWGSGSHSGESVPHQP